MKKARPDWFRKSVARLSSLGTQRAWSVLVTIFGDLAPGDGDQISGAVITRLTSLVGIKSEATRVALHRLRKEGWIESTRIGRNSVHRLTDFGRAQTAAAAPRIYARSVTPAEDWHVVVADGSAAARQELADLMLTGDYISLNSATAMAPGPAPGNTEELMVVQGASASVPDWLRLRCAPAELREAYDALLRALRDAEGRIPDGGIDDPVTVAVLRVLIVHAWRRLILRHPDLPEAFLPEGWNGQPCREIVATLLDRLPRPSLQALEG